MHPPSQEQCNRPQVRDIHADCCRNYDPPMSAVYKFLPSICKSLERLKRRHARMFVKKPRLMAIAQPLQRRCLYVPRCPCRFRKVVEIVPAEQPTYTRTEQLALPLVRRLLQRKAYATKSGDQLGSMILNRLLRYSYLSLYSRLANVEPPKKASKKKKIGPKEKKKRNAYNEQLAVPKKVLKPPKIERTVGKISEKRLKKLTQPTRTVEEVVPVKWEFRPDLATYRPTKRILALAQPKHHESTHIRDDPNKIEPNALKYKASPRINELAQPAAMRERKVDADLKEDPFGIPPNALKYKATARIKELAEPKEYENTHIRDNPFYISPAALAAKASPRTIELAKPKSR